MTFSGDSEMLVIPNTSLGLVAFWLASHPITSYIILVLLLLNLRSFPLAWHVRVFRDVAHIRFRQLLYRFSVFILHRSYKVREEKEQDWLESWCPVGENPHECTYTWTAIATFDDSDFNGHLSNSSYAKILDPSRFRACIKWFPAFMNVGGRVALAGTNYQFIREIPMLAKYQIRISIAAWDHKWVFIVARFVTHIKPKEKKRVPPSPSIPTFTPSVVSPSGSPSPSESSVNLSPTFAPAIANWHSSVSAHKSLQSIALALSHTPEADGATVHCLAVSQMCFKMGRMTVPPAVILASEGFCGPSFAPPAGINACQSEKLDGSPAPSRYSRSSPPPHYIAARALRTGDLSEYRAFLRGGWRDDDQRWWEGAV